MATGLLALLDDMATLLDDVALMSKVAAQKTAGIVGDDLAVNAEQVTGVDPKREIPVVLKVAKGSFINKLIIIPIALLLNAVLPWLIKPLLVLGGLFLCYEGAEKIIHKKTNKTEQYEQDLIAAAKSEADLMAFEKDKIKGAIRTDFILSAEIIVITLGTVAAASFMKQLTVLTIIGIGMTFVVYGLVAVLIKLDDFGLYLTRKRSIFLQKKGELILKAVPPLMKAISIIGTIAMFAVGGGIIAHSIPLLHHITDHYGFLVGALVSIITGLIAGFITLFVIHSFKKLKAFKA
jgi:hypothetical protein